MDSLHPEREGVGGEGDKQNASKSLAGAAHPKARGTLACPKHRCREKAEEMGSSQADPLRAQAPWEVAGTLPSWQGGHGKTVSRKWTERTDVTYKALSGIAGEQAGFMVCVRHTHR